MRMDIWGLFELLRLLDLWDLWKDARDAPEGTTLYRWRYVVKGIVLLIVAPIVLALPLWIILLAGKS